MRAASCEGLLTWHLSCVPESVAGGGFAKPLCRFHEVHCERAFSGTHQGSEGWAVELVGVAPRASCLFSWHFTSFGTALHFGGAAGFCCVAHLIVPFVLPQPAHPALGLQPVGEGPRSPTSPADDPFAVRGQRQYMFIDPALHPNLIYERHGACTACCPLSGQIV